MALPRAPCFSFFRNRIPGLYHLAGDGFHQACYKGVVQRGVLDGITKSNSFRQCKQFANWLKIVIPLSITSEIVMTFLCQSLLKTIHILV